LEAGPNFGVSAYAATPGGFVMKNAETTVGPQPNGPWWNTTLAVVRINDSVSSITIDQDQIWKDGTGVTIGFVLPDLTKFGIPRDCISKRATNRTGQPANDFHWVVQGYYPLFPFNFLLSHNSTHPYTGFSAIPVQGNTVFTWTFPDDVSAGDWVYFGYCVPPQLPHTVSTVWTSNGIITGWIPQMSFVDPNVSSPVKGIKNGVLRFENTVDDPPDSPGGALHAGNISIEWLAGPAPLDDLNEFATLSPLRVDVVGGTHLVAAGATLPLSIPLPPADARFALVKVSIADDASLTDASVDYIQVSLPPFLPTLSKSGMAMLFAFVALIGTVVIGGWLGRRRSA